MRVFALTDVIFTNTRMAPVFPFVWLLLWVMPLGLAVVLWKRPLYQHSPGRQRNELIIGSLVLSWLAISAFTYNELADTNYTAVLLMVVPTGIGLWFYGRWLMKKSQPMTVVADPDTLFP